MFYMKKLSIIIIMLAPFFGISQNLDQNVIGAAGNYAEQENFSLSWTLGEIVIETHTGNNYILTQGFQQGKISVATLTQEEKMDFSIKVFPNPVRNKLYVQTDKTGQLFRLLNMQGQVVKSGKIENKKLSLNFSELPDGMYFLLINNMKTHKIIKH
jgi:hypothetical protein